MIIRYQGHLLFHGAGRLAWLPYLPGMTFCRKWICSKAECSSIYLDTTVTQKPTLTFVQPWVLHKATVLQYWSLWCDTKKKENLKDGEWLPLITLHLTMVLCTIAVICPAISVALPEFLIWSTVCGPANWKKLIKSQQSLFKYFNDSLTETVKTLFPKRLWLVFQMEI